MFGIGMPHLLLLAAIALIAIGPKQLPEVARVIGRFLNDLKKVRDEFTRTIVENRDHVNQNFYNEPLPPPPAYEHDMNASLIPHPHSSPTMAVDEHDQMAFDIHHASDSSASSAMAEPTPDPTSDPTTDPTTIAQKKDS